MKQRQFPFIVLTLVAATLAGCPVASVPPVHAPSQAPLMRKTVASAMVTGKLLAPSNIIAADGANIIAADGANVLTAGKVSIIAADGANIIAADGANARAVLQAKEVRIAGAEVFLADGAGEPIPGLPVVKTDANGVYSVPKVPAGYTYLVVARIATQAGEPARLVTLTRSSAQGATAPISAESTLAATGVIRRFSGALGEYNQARYAEAIQVVRDNLSQVGAVDWASLADVGAKVDALEKRVAALEAAFTDLRQQVQKIEKTLEQLAQDVEQIREGKPEPPAPSAAPASPSPSPSPSPSAVAASVPPSPPASPEVFTLPGQFVGGRSPVDFTPGDWHYGFTAQDAPDGGFAFFKWGTHSSGHQAYINPISADGALVSGHTGEVFLHTGQARDTLVVWAPPKAGIIDLDLKVRSDDPATNGVLVKAFLYRASTTEATQLASQVVVPNTPLDENLPGLAVDPGVRLFLRFNHNGATSHDTVKLNAEIRYQTGALEL